MSEAKEETRNTKEGIFISIPCFLFLFPSSFFFLWTGVRAQVVDFWVPGLQKSGVSNMVDKVFDMAGCRVSFIYETNAVWIFRSTFSAIARTYKFETGSIRLLHTQQELPKTPFYVRFARITVIALTHVSWMQNANDFYYLGFHCGLCSNPSNPNGYIMVSATLLGFWETLNSLV